MNDDEAHATRISQLRAALRSCLKLFGVGGSTESRPNAIAGG